MENLNSKNKMMSYRIIEELVDSRVYVLALLLSYQQINILNTRTRPKEFVNYDFAHETYTNLI